MANYIITRDKLIYQEYLKLKEKHLKTDDIVDELSKRVWIIDNQPECLGEFSIKNIISKMKKKQLTKIQNNSKIF